MILISAVQLAARERKERKEEGKASGQGHFGLHALGEGNVPGGSRQSSSLCDRCVLLRPFNCGFKDVPSGRGLSQICRSYGAEPRLRESEIFRLPRLALRRTPRRRAPIRVHPRDPRA
jgi:hypothetical protein